MVLVSISGQYGGRFMWFTTYLCLVSFQSVLKMHLF